MNRKNYYKNFHRIKIFSVIILITGVIGVALSFLHFIIKSLWVSANFLFYLNLTSYFSYGISLYLLLYSFYIVIEEIKYRNKNDSISNLRKSVVQTFKFRNAIKKSINNDMSEQRDLTIEDFNRRATKSIVDIHNNQIIVIIYIPKTIWAKQLLDNSLSDIRETISSYNPTWYFSSPTKENNHYIISGRKNFK